MGSDTRVRIRTLKPKIIAIALALFLLASFGAAVQYTSFLLGYDHIYEGVTISGINVGDCTKEQAIAKVRDALGKNAEGLSADTGVSAGKLDETSFVIKCGDYSNNFTYKDIGVSYDLGQAAEKAYDVGHEGLFTKRLLDIFTHQFKRIDIDIPFSYDKNKLSEIVASFSKSAFQPVQDPRLEVTDTYAVIYTGNNGRSLNPQGISSEIEKMINWKTGGTVELTPLVVEKNIPDANVLQKKISRDAADAHYVINNKTYQLVPHVVGRYISLSDITEVLKQVKDKDGAVISLPVDFRLPAITSDKASDLLFRDTLSTMSTHFPTSSAMDKNRKVNITLSSGQINNLIIPPGGVFSFNDIVGQRTPVGGYVTARAYYQGRIIQSIGGGICQVSSTLYNAALLAGLEIVERRNHTFTVSYVPLGRDATVSYGDPDFKFRNNTAWPVKISTMVTQDNNLMITLTGTNESPNRQIELRSQVLSETPFNIVVTHSPDLPAGTTVVTQAGKKGYVVDTYKIVKENGKIVSEYKITRSIYKPLDEEITSGTRSVSPALSSKAK